jgi:hypothetical protein
MVNVGVKQTLKKNWFKRTFIFGGLVCSLGFSLTQIHILRTISSLQPNVYQLGVDPSNPFFEVSNQSKITVLDVGGGKVEIVVRFWDSPQNENQALFLLGMSGLASLLFLLLLFRLPRLRVMPLVGQLIYFLPEECVAEFGAFHQRLKSQKCSKLLIQLLLLYCVIELFWVFYIRIQIDNFLLPSNKKIDE